MTYFLNKFTQNCFLTNPFSKLKNRFLFFRIENYFQEQFPNSPIFQYMGYSPIQHCG